MNGIYRVRAGDTLSRLAVRFRTSLARLASVNRISNPDRIRAGQVLSVPGPEAAPVLGTLSRKY